MIGFWLLIAAQGTIADSEQLHRVDKAFVCPENLPNDVARVQALAKFDADMAKAVKDITIDQLGAARLYLLKKHRCFATLANLQRNLGD